MISLLSFLSSAKSCSSRVWEGYVICRAGYLVFKRGNMDVPTQSSSRFGQREGLGHDRFEIVFGENFGSCSELPFDLAAIGRG
jgi:hypothetical protein